MHALVGAGVAFSTWLGGSGLCTGRLQVLQNLFGAFHDGGRHAGEACHVDAEGVLRTTALQFAQEDHLAVHLTHGHVPVLDARKVFLHLVEFVVVRSEERAGMRLRIFVDVLHDGPGDGYAVVSRRAAPQFVEEHERTLREVVHDVGGFGHLHHKRALPHRNVVAGTDTGEDFVDHADLGRLGGYEGAYLGQEGDECRLAEQGTFTRHVRSGDNDDLLFLGVQLHVVGRVVLAGRHEGFDDRVAASANVEGKSFVDYGSHVMSLSGHGSEALQRIKPAEG